MTDKSLQLKTRLQKIAQNTKKDILERIKSSEDSVRGKHKILEIFLESNKDTSDVDVRKQVDAFIMDILYSCLDIVRSKRELKYLGDNEE